MTSKSDSPIFRIFSLFMNVVDRLLCCPCIVHILLFNVFFNQVAIVHRSFPDMFHIHPSLNKCLINEAYAYMSV
jgi:hypothetical protein